MKRRSQHPTLPLEYGGRLVRIDVGLVPLIQACWERGIRTQGCCQGDGEAYLGFPSTADAYLCYRQVLRPRLRGAPVRLSARKKYARSWLVHRQQLWALTDWPPVTVETGTVLLHFELERVRALTETE